METKQKKWGGSRQGSGKKSIYGEPTKAMAVPISRHAEVKEYLLGDTRENESETLSIPENWACDYAGDGPIKNMGHFNAVVDIYISNSKGSLSTSFFSAMDILKQYIPELNPDSMTYFCQIDLLISRGITETDLEKLIGFGMGVMREGYLGWCE